MNLEDLGRRAVACKHFYWMPGMSLSNGRTIGTWKEGEVCGSSDTNPPYDGAVYPMLDDPATLGCLLHLVREAWGDPDLSADLVSRAHDNLQDVWQVYVFHESGVKDVLSGHSEVEALVAALGAAP